MTRLLTQFEIDRQRQNTEINARKMWDAKCSPCADCKLQWHPYCMTFDHIDRRAATKNKNAKTLNSILYYNPEMFQRVMNGCSVVCRNCHMIRELRRDIKDPKVGKRNKVQMQEMLERCRAGGLMEDTAS
ncbi:hypothetical protein [Rhodococcus sp. NPDC004095]